MIKILTGTQMKNVDNKAIKDFKIPSLILMENAGRAIADKVLEILKQSVNSSESVLVICGKGNNGGDGFVAARHLAENGINVSVVSLYKENDLKGDALINHDILKYFTDIVYYSDLEQQDFREILSISTVLIDAIFGTGLSSEVSNELYKIVEDINQFCEGSIVSVDIPSGVDSDTGKVLGNAIFADYTVTFFAPKLGSFLYPGAEYSGEVNISDISIPKSLIGNSEFNINLITPNYVSKHLPHRQKNSHKGLFGKVFNIAGSLGMSGAAYMASISSLKTGAGYSLLAISESLIPTISVLAPEVICIPIKDYNSNNISVESIDFVLEKSVNSDCYLIGPGIGTESETIDFVYKFIQNLINNDKKVIIDADALNCLALKENFKLPSNSVITPHPKELSRLLKVPVSDILDNRIKYAKLASEKFNSIVLLKGANSIIATPRNEIFINPTGNSGLSTAGSGDILAGMIAGFAAQNVELKDAVAIATFLHGLAADIAVKELSKYSLTATDLLNYISKAINKISK